MKTGYMDPRIQAILAQYEEEEKREELKHKPKTPEPPKSFEQWLQGRPEGFKQWPDAVEFEKEFNVSVASVGLGSLEDIMIDLGHHARILFDYPREIYLGCLGVGNLTLAYYNYVLCVAML